eukprot:5185977-Pyramimonas_sp.AAC.1
MPSCCHDRDSFFVYCQTVLTLTEKGTPAGVVVYYRADKAPRWAAGGTGPPRPRLDRQTARNP